MKEQKKSILINCFTRVSAERLFELCNEIMDGAKVKGATRVGSKVTIEVEGKRT